MSDSSSSDARTGLLLLVAAAAAVIVSNSPLAWCYERLLEVPLAVRLGDAGLSKPVLLWINDGLMALFFLLVGIEVKRELLEGRLRDKRAATLPVVAAFGGML